MPAMQAKPVTPATLSICAAILLVAALFYGARQPVAVHLFAEPYDKLAHAALFATLAYILAASRPHRFSSLSWLVSCALAATTVGLADEIHQMFIPGRSAGLGDVAADAMGALLGVTLWSGMVHTAHRVTEKLNNC